MARLGGAFLALFGAAFAVLAWALAQAMMRRPVPELPGLAGLKPYFDEIAEGSPLPAGAGFGELVGASAGMVALAAVAAGGMILLGGLVQIVLGRRNHGTIALLTLALGGFALAAVMSA